MLRQTVTVATLLAAVLAPIAAHSVTIDVQPIRVCDDAGMNCAAVSTFEAYTNKIYAQRGDTVNFLPVKTLNSSKYLTLDTVAEADELIGSTTGTQRSSGAYDMWFVKSIVGPRAGRAALSGDGSVISNAIIGLNRVDTVAHELMHNLGANHSSSTIIDAPRYLMAPGGIREIPTQLSDVAPDGKQLSRLEPILPMVQVDTVGSTPFNAQNFFKVNYLSGAAIDLFLTKLTVNLRPADAFTDPTNSPPGRSGSGFGFTNLNGLTLADLSVSGIFDGSQMFEIMIADGAFAPGESFSFGVDIDLFSAIDRFGATPNELRRVVLDFEFSNGFTFTDTLDDLIAVSSFDPLANIDKTPIAFADPDPLPSLMPVPAPMLFLPALAVVPLVGLYRRQAD